MTFSNYPKSFFLEELKILLKNIQPETKPQWGIMTPQHMIEHLVGAWRISNGNARVKLSVKPNDVPKRKAFLMSDMLFPKGVQKPVTKGGLGKLRKANLTEAKNQLFLEVDAFFIYHEANADALEIHPAFGPLTKDEWIRFQSKHMYHHLSQFGLM